MLGQWVVFKRVSMGARIGHEARMFSVTLKRQGFTFIFYAVIWRYSVVKAAVFVGGLNGSVDAADAVRLAQRQQTRILAATR